MLYGKCRYSTVQYILCCREQYTYCTVQYKYCTVQYKHCTVQYKYCTVQYKYSTVQYKYCTVQTLYYAVQYPYCNNTCPVQSPRPEVVLVLSRSRSVTPQESGAPPGTHPLDQESGYSHRSVIINHMSSRPPKILESPMDSKSLISGLYEC